jgi:hypothetical protein
MSDWKGKTKILKDLTIIVKTENTGLTFCQQKLLFTFFGFVLIICVLQQQEAFKTG